MFVIQKPLDDASISEDQDLREILIYNRSDSEAERPYQKNWTYRLQTLADLIFF